MFSTAENRGFLTNFPKVLIVTYISIDNPGIFTKGTSFLRHSLAIFLALLYNEYVCGYPAASEIGSKK